MKAHYMAGTLCMGALYMKTFSGWGTVYRGHWLRHCLKMHSPVWVLCMVALWLGHCVHSYSDVDSPGNLWL